MKKLFLITFVFQLFFIANIIIAQGYFVAGAGKYVESANFKTNVQDNLTKYEGRYIATSETYESNYTFEINANNNALNIVLICGSTFGREDNWEQDTLIIKNVVVENGKFNLNFKNNISGDEANKIYNFRFVKCTYKKEGNNKTIKSEGLVWEEFKMFAEKSE